MNDQWSLLTRQVPLSDKEVKAILANQVITLPPEKEVKHRDYQTYGEARYWQERVIREKGPAFTAVVRNKKAR